MKLADYLGAPASTLMSNSRFAACRFVRSEEVELPLPEVWYESKKCGISLVCGRDETIRTIFLRRDLDLMTGELRFAMRRRQVLDLLGNPSKSGGPTRHPVLGESGAWDRFRREQHSVHVQYGVDDERIELLTLIRPDAAP